MTVVIVFLFILPHNEFMVKKVILPIFFLCLFFVPTSVQAAAATESVGLSASAHVRARQMDFQFGLTSDHPTNTVGADEEIEYTVKYGSWLDYRAPMMIEVDCSLGHVPQDNLYSYNIVTYVSGSATNDYWGQTVPQIDLVHRKIIWNIASFPNYTIDKTLRFKLRTAGHYVTDKNVNFTVTAKMVGDGVTLDPINLDQTYMPSDFIKKEINGMQIQAMEIRQVTDTSFSVYLATNVPTKAVIFYGTTPDNLDKTISDLTMADQKTIMVSGLYPATTYYFKIQIESEKGVRRLTPEIFTVTTSSTSLISLIDLNRVLLTSRGVLLNNTQGLGEGTSVMVPTNVAVETYLPFRKLVPQTVYLSLQNRKVLGLSTDQPLETSDQKIRLLATQTDTYTGAITAPKTPGVYDMMLEAVAEDGSVSRDIMATMVVSNPIKVVNIIGMPVESALVYLERFNPATGIYEYFPAPSFGSRNPTYTAVDGTTDFILPEGNYTINVNAIGFNTYQKPFTFNPSGSAPYPAITLITSPFNLTTYIRYYMAVALDSLKFFNYSVDQVSVSNRFLDLSLLVGLFILSALSFLSNLVRIKLSFEGLYIKIERRIRRTYSQQKFDNLYIGFVENDFSLPVHGAVVTVFAKKSRSVIARDVTNVIGEFRVRLYPGLEYEITVKKSGYEVLRSILAPEVLYVRQKPLRLIPTRKHELPEFLSFSGMVITSLAIGLSDAFLFAVGILNVLLLYRLGVKVMPIMILTAINTFLWLEFQWGNWKTHRR
jgi:hypothetical protein